MENNPLGAILGAGSSLIGSLLNTSSQQAINTQNIQNSMWSAQGGYLPGLIMNANKAGINPLALLGQHAPSIAQAVQTDPGRGLQDIGAQIFRTPHQARMEDLEYQRGQVDLANQRQFGNNAAIRGAVDAYTLGVMKGEIKPPGPYLPEGISQKSPTSWFDDWYNRVFAPRQTSVGSPADIVTRGFKPFNPQPSWLNP